MSAEATSLASLPWQTQVVLASGFLGYAIGYVGRRGHHTTFDAVMLSLTFSLVALGGMTFGPVLAKLVPISEPVLQAIAALASAVLAGIVWRAGLNDATDKLWRDTNLSWSGDAPSTLHQICANTRYRITKASVQLTDGRWLYCDTPLDFGNAPHGPITYSRAGDVALYVTHVRLPNGEVEAIQGVNDPHWGAELTYVPSSEVRRMVLRYQPRAKPLAAVVAEDA